MEQKSKHLVFVASSISIILALFLFGQDFFGQDLETIGRPNIAAVNCPNEWAAIVAVEPDRWADNAIEFNPAVDQATTDARNKYTISLMALADYTASLANLAGEDAQTQSNFDRTKAEFDLFSCLRMHPTELNQIVEIFHAARPSMSKDEIRTNVFGSHDMYECLGMAQVSDQIFRLDIQSVTFQSEYEQIMSTRTNECS